MKKIFLYKKWNFLVLLNNLVTSGFLIYQKKVLFLHFDVNKFFFWTYSKKLKFKNTKTVQLKKLVGWL